MSDTAYRSVLIEEGLTAIQGHDFSALKLMNESGIVKSFDRKTLKAFQTAQGVIDTDNFNMSEAARLQYKSIIDNDSSSYKEVARARQEFDATRLQVQARNTGTSKHIKTTFGSDRWRGELGKQYQNRLKAEASERDDKRNKAIDLNASSFQAQLYGATPERRRTILADRLDELQTAINGDLPDAVRKDLNGQFVAGKKQLERWQSAEDAQRKKEDEKLEQKEKEDRDIEDGVTSLVTGGGYVTGDSKNQNLAIKGAVESVANQIIPDTEMKGVDKLEAILGDPANIYKFIKGSGISKVM